MKNDIVNAPKRKPYELKSNLDVFFVFHNETIMVIKLINANIPDSNQIVIKVLCEPILFNCFLPMIYGDSPNP